MMRTLKSGLTIGMLVAALAVTSGCGDNDNSGDNGNDNGGSPIPTRTATPATGTDADPDAGRIVRTATPTATGGNARDADGRFRLHGRERHPGLPGPRRRTRRPTATSPAAPRT